MRFSVIILLWILLFNFVACGPVPVGPVVVGPDIPSPDVTVRGPDTGSPYPNDRTGTNPSYMPTPAPGFVISNIRYVIEESGTDGFGYRYALMKRVTVDFSGANGGVNEIFTFIYPHDNWVRYKASTNCSTCSSGSAQSGHYIPLKAPESGHTRYKLMVYITDKAGRESNVLQEIFTY